MKLPILTLITCFGLSICNAELFSAVENMEKLFGEQKRLLELFAKHELPHHLAEKVEKWKSESDKAEENVIEYIGNPLNAFLMIKRMSLDYKQIQDLLKIEPGSISTDEFDLLGAVEGLLRLQPFYKQKSLDFAQEYFAAEYLSLAWGMSYRSSSDDDLKTALIREIVKLVNETEHYEQQVLELYQNDDSLEDMRDELLKELKHFKSSLETPYVDSFTKLGYYLHENEMIYIGQVCRGEVVKSPREQAGLRCKFVSNSPFSMIAPFKVEEANLDPYIVVFIDVLSDSEIEVMKNITKPNIYRAEVATNDSAQFKSSNQIRVAQLAWFNDEDHEIVARISRRVEVSWEPIDDSIETFSI
jgi:prolyl 4-hydroxylase